MNPLRYIKALFGLGDIDAFWMAREEILKRPGKYCLEIIFVRLSESIMVRAFLFCLISTALQRHMAFTGFSSHRERKSARVV